MNVTLDRWAWAVGRAIGESGFADTMFKEAKKCKHVRQYWYGMKLPCADPGCPDVGLGEYWCVRTWRGEEIFTWRFERIQWDGHWSYALSAAKPEKAKKRTTNEEI